MCREGETKGIKSTTKQALSGEALSKQNIKTRVASLSCDLSQVLTKWTAIFASVYKLSVKCYDPVRAHSLFFGFRSTCATRGKFLGADLKILGA